VHNGNLRCKHPRISLQLKTVSLPISTGQWVEKSSRNHAPRFKGAKWLGLSARARRLRKHKQVCDCKTDKADDEYELEKIVEAH
jgi:hypothetical protein